MAAVAVCRCVCVCAESSGVVMTFLCGRYDELKPITGCCFIRYIGGLCALPSDLKSIGAVSHERFIHCSATRCFKLLSTALLEESIGGIFGVAVLGGPFPAGSRGADQAWAGARPAAALISCPQRPAACPVAFDLCTAQLSPGCTTLDSCTTHVLTKCF